MLYREIISKMSFSTKIKIIKFFGRNAVVLLVEIFGTNI